MKRLLSGIGAALFGVLLATVGVASASAQGFDPGAHGKIGYTAYGLHRNAKFSVEPESQSCAPWNVNGKYTFDFVYNGGHYVHDATITNQNSAGKYNISGGYPAGGPFTYAWSGTGNVSGTAVTNSVNYTVGAPGTHMDMTGTIASNGKMSGMWSDNFGGTRSGTWSTASGAATAVFGCKGEGNFRYSDANHDWYKVDVKYVKVSGSNAWFAGRVVKANQKAWIGNWLFAEVHDGGSSSDQIWGSFTSENSAKMGVANMTNPADGPFTVTSGDLEVHL